MDFNSLAHLNMRAEIKVKGEGRRRINLPGLRLSFLLIQLFYLARFAPRFAP